MDKREPLIPKHGGYRKLKSFQVAELVYDVTVRFCDRYIERRSRTHDQMVQAARSGVQNIAEGSQMSAISKKMELKLTGVARGSLEELHRDYVDFLRQRNLPCWPMDDPRRQKLIDRRCATAEEVARWTREIHNSEHAGNAGGMRGRQSGGPAASSHSFQSTPSTPSTHPEIAANAALVLIAVANALLDRQIAALADTFEQEGGFSERLYRVRRQRKDTP